MREGDTERAKEAVMRLRVDLTSAKRAFLVFKSCDVGRRCDERESMMTSVIYVSW